MDCPDGLEHEPDECLILLKAIYGLVQAARQWYKRFVEHLKSIGFELCLADLCMLRRVESN
jgi:hypothetical protein